MKTAAQYTPERPHGWMDDASCGSLPGFDRLPIARQQAICADCPVRGKCGEWMEARLCPGGHDLAVVGVDGSDPLPRLPGTEESEE